MELKSHADNLARVKAGKRQLEELCDAAARLRVRITRQTRAAHAREKLARDDAAVTAAGARARKTR